MELTLQQKRLERLKNRRTRYEVAMIRGEERILLCYMSCRTRDALYHECARRIDSIVKHTGTAVINFGRLVADGATMGAWSIRFTGRTQRECIMGVELPYVGDVCAPHIVAEMPTETVFVV